MNPEGIGDDRLDDVTVTHCHVDSLVTEPLVPVAHRCDCPVLHLRHGLPVGPGEHGSARVCLHDAPHGLLREFLERLACPIAVPALAEPVIGVPGNGAPLRSSNDVSGLLRPVERRCDDSREADA